MAATQMNIRSRAIFPTVTRLTGGELGRDLVAGLTLAAIAIPEQMATARLGHFPPEAGFLAFVAGALGFAALGTNRYLSAGADSTITPIFAGGLALSAAAGSPAYASSAALLALMVGGAVALAGWLRMGWISSLLSVPVTGGFLAGISVHILASQLPAIMGMPANGTDVLARFAALFSNIGHTNPYTLGLGLGVFAVIVSMEKWGGRLPGALVAVAGASALVFLLGLERHGVPVLGRVSASLPGFPLVTVTPAAVFRCVPLALMLALVVMVQTAATTRSFPSIPDTPPDIDRDFVGVGAGSIIAGLFGAFPVNASPPRTAIAMQAGAQTQMTGLFAALIVTCLAFMGAGLLAHIPDAALAGVLLFVALRILQFRLFRAVWRDSRGEFALIAVTAIAIVVMPIEAGVALGILLSLMHGIWTVTRTRLVEFERVPGTSIWWPPGNAIKGEKIAGVLVIAFQAPLSFLNADDFRRGFLEAIARGSTPLALVVLEASSIVEIDFTAAHVLLEAILHARGAGAAFAIARLESVRAQEALARFGIADLVGTDKIYHSVEQAIDAFSLAREKHAGQTGQETA